LAAGWDGDRYQVLGRGSAPGTAALVWYTLWDDKMAAARFRKGLESAWAKRGPGGRGVRRSQIEQLLVAGVPVVRLVDAPPRWAVRRDLGPLQPAYQPGRHPGRCGAGARLARQGGAPDRHGPLAAQEGGSAGQTARLVGRVRKPHGQRGEVAVFPLVENPGAVFTPKARLLVVNEERDVVAGPLVVGRGRGYHREWPLA